MFEENNNDYEMNQESFGFGGANDNAYTSPNNPYGYMIEEYKQKSDIRRTCLIIGIPSLCLSAIGYFWKYAYLFLMVAVFGLSREQAVEIYQNPATKQIIQIILSCIMFLVPYTIAAKTAGVNIDQTVNFGRAKKGTFLPFVFFGLGFCAFANISTAYASSFFEQFMGDSYNVPDVPDAGGFYGFLLSFISTAIVPALVEEFACRGIILGLLKKYGEGFAIITSALIFGVMHGNFDQIPFATMVGLILGYMYVKTGSIWPCVLVHGINNSISVIFNYMPSSISADVQNAIYLIYLVTCMLLALVGLWILSKKGNEKFTLNRTNLIISEKQKYTTFFTSWVIIVFLATNLNEAFGYFSFWE